MNVGARSLAPDTARRIRWLGPIVALGFALVAAGRPSADGLVDAIPPEYDPDQVLEKTFDNLYDYDMTTTLTLVLHNGRGEESIRRAEVARKRIDGRLHAYGRFLDPPWMRGTSVLVIDNLERSDDHFLFLPEHRRVRRVTNVQRTDSFLGSDLWYEDLERRHVEDYRTFATRAADFAGEPALVISAEPIAHSGYARVDFTIARRDHLLLQTAFFKADSDDPFKTITLPSRDDTVFEDGHRIPIRLSVENLRRGTRTEARFEKLRVNPEISDSLFTSAALESQRAVRGSWRRRGRCRDFSSRRSEA